MIPPDIRLYTWVDVEDVLLRLQPEELPDWLVWIRAYWNGLSLAIKPGYYNEMLDWLNSHFSPRYDAENRAIILEGSSDFPRLLPISIEETDEDPVGFRFVPTFARPSTIRFPQGQAHPEPLPEDYPPVIAFHSFKGGVGRTIHAIGFAQTLVKPQKASSVLLIDADLEAPGITWLLNDRFPSPNISFADFLTLVHGEDEADLDKILNLVASEISQMGVDNIFMLPAFRTAEQFRAFEIRPEHLIKGSADPFILTNLIAALGATLGVGAVIVDLRAGLSEISSGLLFDPRVYRVFVTTLSAQSIQGTLNLLELLAVRSPAKHSNEPFPSIIISQVPDEVLRNRDDFLTDVTANIYSIAKQFDAVKSEEDELKEQETEVDPQINIVTTRFDSNLLVLPEIWETITQLIMRSDLPDNLSVLREWLPNLVPSETVTFTKSAKQDLKLLRQQLTSFASTLQYAETGKTEDFLSIDALRKLASDFSTRTPIAVVVGAKGSGKTYTYLQIARRQTWQNFGHAAGIRPGSGTTFIIPVLSSLNLQEDASSQIQNLADFTSNSLGLGAPVDRIDINNYIRDSLREKLHEGDWTDRWLNIFAWRAGFEPESPEAGRDFINHLRKSGQVAVGIIDGLEDIFQDVVADEKQQVALRSLLQEVPIWLEQQPSRPLGILAFVRRDMVSNAVRQNAEQLLARYNPYTLRWNSEEALRLVCWIAQRANVLPTEEEPNWITLTQSELSEMLDPLWGRKLGGPNSNEARSSEWVIAALSDFRGQIQARDLVSFLYYAAAASQRDAFWEDRILVPSAIRSAIKDCSAVKIQEISKENRRLANIFQKLTDLPEDYKRAPFTREQVQLDLEEIRVLEDNGVVLREGVDYFLPEIFRSGLGFKLKVGARPRVLALLRRVRKSS